MLVGLAGWWLHFGATLTPWFIYDDSYITLSNALTLIGKKSYFSSPALTGATSIFHALVVALFATFFSPEFALAFSNFLGTFFYVAGWITLAQHLGFSRSSSILIGLLSCTAGFTSLHLYNGLETSLALAGIVWSLVFLIQKKGDWLAILCGVLPWLRPELAAWSGIVLALWLWDNRLQGQLKKNGLRAALLFLCGTAPFLIICYFNTGHPIPQTVSAKQFFFSEDCAPSTWKTGVVLKNIETFIVGLWFVVLGFLLMTTSRIGLASLVFCTVFLGAYWINFPGALGHYHQRYLHILVPFAIFSLMLGISRFLNGRHQQLSTASILVLTTPILILNLPATHIAALEGAEFSQRRLAPVAHWINSHTMENSKILVHDAGYIGFSAQRQLRDFVGLKTPQVIKYHRTITNPTCGKERVLAIGKIIDSERPEYVILLNNWDRIFDISSQLKNHGISLKRVFFDPFGYNIYQIMH